jgi:UDP-glucuronate 4-epimerase
MRILLTGAAGFIGSNCSKRLTDSGLTVLGLDNFDNYYSRDVKKKNLELFSKNPKFFFQECDINDYNELVQIVTRFNPDLIIHLAAKPGVRTSFLIPSEYFHVNVGGSINLIEAALKVGCKKLIVASSSTVYGESKSQFMSEEDNTSIQTSPYGISKKVLESVCSGYSKFYGLDITCLRFFTAYGPQMRPDLSIHNFTKTLLSDGDIEIYGSGKDSRDFVYVEDIVSAILLSISRLQGFNIFNIGTSVSTSLLDLVNILKSITSSQSKIIFKPREAYDVSYTCADITKSNNYLGYCPKFNISDGLQLYVNWYKKNIESIHNSVI